MTTTTANRPYMTVAAEWGRFHMISLPIVFIGVSFEEVGGYFYQTPPGGSSQFFMGPVPSCSRSAGFRNILAASARLATKGAADPRRPSDAGNHHPRLQRPFPGYGQVH